MVHRVNLSLFDTKTKPYSKLFPTQSISESKDSLIVWNLSQSFGSYTLVLKINYKIIEYITLRISLPKPKEFQKILN